MPKASPRVRAKASRPSRATTFIALLRGINVGGNKRVPMDLLRKLAHKLGFRWVETYIQSGNLVLVSELERADVEAALEGALRKALGFSVEVVVRSEREWRAYAAGSPFPEAETERPNLLHLGVAKQRLAAGAHAKLLPYAQAGERLHALGDALWLDFPVGVARSKLSPAVLDRLVGSIVTARNFRTVQKLAELAASATAREIAGAG